MTAACADAAARSFSDTLACGLALTCRGSKPCSRVITAHRIRAFLLAMATQAFCQPTRAVSCTNQREVGSSRLPALITADFALDDVEDSDPEQGAERAVLLRQIEALVATRPEVEREALRLHYFEDLSLDEVGARLGLHKSWVCRVLARTIEALAKQVREGPS